MRLEVLDFLRCPFCGGRLTLDRSAWHQQDVDDIQNGILACHCCTFPVVAGIPVMHLGGPATEAAEHIRHGLPDLARRALCAADHADRFDAIVSSPDSTYADAVHALVPTLEASYFVHRFSDPSFVVAHAVTRAVAGTVLRRGGRAIDLCGGSGHLTRSLLDLSAPPPVVADLYFAKLWLARQFTAPGCEAVCLDANLPLPFARGTFRYAMCADAFMFIWPKRQLVGEMLRLIDERPARGAVVISHAHNQLQWSPSHGEPLPPSGYRDLFETSPVRMFAESGLFGDVVNRRPLDLSRRDQDDHLDADPALVMVSSDDPAVFRAHALDAAIGPARALRLNPLYAPEPEGDHVRLRLQFPSVHYEEEFGGACREYLPETVVVDRAAFDALEAGLVTSELRALADRRVLLALPERYY